MLQEKIEIYILKKYLVIMPYLYLETPAYFILTFENFKSLTIKIVTSFDISTIYIKQTRFYRDAIYLELISVLSKYLRILELLDLWKRWAQGY